VDGLLASSQTYACIAVTAPWWDAARKESAAVAATASVAGPTNIVQAVTSKYSDGIEWQAKERR